MLGAHADFEAILRREESASWNLDEALGHLRLDLTKPFLPESLAQTGNLDCLNEREKLRLNQIQGHAYAHLFFYVEEFIVAHTRKLLDTERPFANSEAGSLHCLVAQERKHQALFLAFKDAFAQQAGLECQCVGDHVDAARAICAHSDLSVMLLMTMLEWVTQRHYMLSFKREGNELDPSFCSLFHLHWIEEAHHTSVDTLELEHLAEQHVQTERQQAVVEFLSLCNLLEQVLHRQAEFDLGNFSRLLERKLPDTTAGPVLDALYRSYNYMFLGLGLCHPVFLKIVDDIAPGNDGLLLQRSYRHTRPVRPN